MGDLRGAVEWLRDSGARYFSVRDASRTDRGKDAIERRGCTSRRSVLIADALVAVRMTSPRDPPVERTVPSAGVDWLIA
jgi:hypothetical protein